MTHENISIEEALKLLAKGESVYYPSQYGTILMLEIDPEFIPKGCWQEIAHLLYYESLYKKVKKEQQ